jgi:hypothetical protein
LARIPKGSEVHSLDGGWRLLVLAVVSVLAACEEGPMTPQSKPEPVKIAFIGDQGWEPAGLYDGPRAVLRLIKDEGADVVLHQGDLDYGDNPDHFTDMIDDELGSDFPYFVSVGNHDVHTAAWERPDGYRDRLEARARRLGYQWAGDYGERASLSINGIRVLIGAPGIFEGVENSVYADYFAQELARDTATWRICSWHKNQGAMQVGLKRDDAGWGVYEACRAGGAVIATGHEHSYSRTHLLSDMSEQVIASTSDTLEITLGRTFAFVSGLGGRSIRDQSRDDAWWASVYTATQGATHGALFAEFHDATDPTLARFYFKNIAGDIVDEFWVRSRVRD